MVIYKYRLKEFLIQGEAIPSIGNRIYQQLELQRYSPQPLQFVPIIILQCNRMSTFQSSAQCFNILSQQQYNCLFVRMQKDIKWTIKITYNCNQNDEPQILTKKQIRLLGKSTARKKRPGSLASCLLWMQLNTVILFSNQLQLGWPLKFFNSHGKRPKVH